MISRPLFKPLNLLNKPRDHRILEFFIFIFYFILFIDEINQESINFCERLQFANFSIMINFTLINKTELFTVLLLISVLLHPICMSFAQVKYHEFIKVVTFSEEICTGVPTNVASVTKARSLIHCCSICAKKIYFKESCYAVDYLERNKMCRLILNVSYRLVNVSSNISCNLYEVDYFKIIKYNIIIIKYHFIIIKHHFRIYDPSSSETIEKSPL